MKAILWFRAAIRLNFFNWNHSIIGSTEAILQNAAEVKKFELGQLWSITSINRDTGKLTLRLND